MILREMPIGDINGAEYNPRISLKPGMPEFERLRKSIETFGAVEPLVWNERTQNLVGGHQRLVVMRHLGYSTVTVSVVDLGLHDEKLLNIALNKISGQWDYHKLEEVLSEFEFDEALLTGFSAQELTLLIASYEQEDLDYDIDDTHDDNIVDFDGASWVVTLVFPSKDEANKWLELIGKAPITNSRTKSHMIRADSL